MGTSGADVPPDVIAEQVWRDPGGQHYRVALVANGVATLNRCTAAGRVLNPRYTEKVPVEWMRSAWRLVIGG
jgi:hypothetical protein